MMNEEIECIYSKRKSMSLQVKSDGSLLVRAPIGTKDKAIKKLILDHEDWIKNARLRLEDFIHLPKITPDMDALLREETRRKAMRFLKTWPGPKPHKVFIKDQKTRWGSCSSLGNINLNLRLALLPDQLFEYVLVHELCHLKELNHSKTYWELVEHYMPDYKKHRAQLKRIRFS